MMLFFDILYLTSDESKFVTGSELVIDGLSDEEWVQLITEGVI